MGKKIIVAGGGHGGIAAASILASNGYDVTVYERHARDAMGYEWTDIFDKAGFTAAGMPLPPQDKFKLKEDMTFVGPAETIKLRQNTDPENLEIQMERKDIYTHLITQAQQNGAKFVFECEITGPVLFGNRVVGIQTAQGIVYADLVIDAAGLHSPIREQLPESLGVQTKVGEYERFFVYRAFFNKAAETAEDKFKIYLLREGKLGICWVAAEETHTDVLIGRFEPFDIEEANRTIASLRESNPAIGTEIVRGNQFVEIPVRQALGLLVADGYAAIGDSAFMTVPMIGSGIANSLKASRLLADAVMADTEGAFSASTLWKYQRDFVKNIGAPLAPMACVKLLLTRLQPQELDYIFETGILNGDDMTMDATSTSLSAIFSGMKPADVMTKVRGVIKNPAVLQKILRLGKQIAAATLATSTMPRSYSPEKACARVKNYNNAFKR